MENVPSDRTWFPWCLLLMEIIRGGNSYMCTYELPAKSTHNRVSTRSYNIANHYGILLFLAVHIRLKYLFLKRNPFTFVPIRRRTVQPASIVKIYLTCLRWYFYVGPWNNGWFKSFHIVHLYPINNKSSKYKNNNNDDCISIFT